MGLKSSEKSNIFKQQTEIDAFTSVLEPGTIHGPQSPSEDDFHLKEVGRGKEKVLEMLLDM